jgi:hypothetical protein
VAASGTPPSRADSVTRYCVRGFSSEDRLFFCRFVGLGMRVVCHGGICNARDMVFKEWFSSTTCRRSRGQFLINGASSTGNQGIPHDDKRGLIKTWPTCKAVVRFENHFRVGDNSPRISSFASHNHFFGQYNEHLSGYTTNQELASTLGLTTAERLGYSGNCRII